ncbi:hypothetical protein SAMN02745181_0315 [Rubritalea squalenifaciens DSM 18772]|uniref:DUF4476 domain-containing protein n=2 Tax=Rubritalea squalenifaciens TaxID=407226 RepID=A0A1M6BUV3_9BACT|nr:hypothetical protein SAMN02745181_0315 [Rubritalea squalenifaciens DSM 18772]
MRLVVLPSSIAWSWRPLLETGDQVRFAITAPHTMKKVLTLTLAAQLGFMALPLSARDPNEPYKTPEQLLSLPSEYNPADLKTLAAKENRTGRENSTLSRLILMAAVKKDASCADLLKDKELLKNEQIKLALAAYDYNLNQSRAALDTIFARMAIDPMGGDVDSIVALGVVDEWDLSIRAFQKHFYHTDGAGAHCMRYFLKMRATLNPEKYASLKDSFKYARMKTTYEAYLPDPSEQNQE